MRPNRRPLKVGSKRRWTPWYARASWTSPSPQSRVKTASIYPRRQTVSRSPSPQSRVKTYQRKCYQRSHSRLAVPSKSGQNPKVHARQHYTLKMSPSPQSRVKTRLIISPHSVLIRSPSPQSRVKTHERACPTEGHASVAVPSKSGQNSYTLPSVDTAKLSSPSPQSRVKTTDIAIVPDRCPWSPSPQSRVKTFTRGESDYPEPESPSPQSRVKTGQGKDACL